MFGVLKKENLDSDLFRYRYGNVIKDVKFVGRYGEELQEVREVKDLFQETEIPEGRKFLIGYGQDKSGNKRLVLFYVSRKTNKKEGIYRITLAEKLPMKFPYDMLLECNYNADHLNGLERDYKNNIFTYWSKGKQVESPAVRKDLASRKKSLRKLFSNPTVQEAIKTGNLLKIKTAMTKALGSREREL